MPLVCVAGSGSRYYTSTPPAEESFNFYISPTGLLTNSGEDPSAAWPISALWNKESTYRTYITGVIDGVYAGYNGTNISGNDVAHYIPSGAAGTSGARTVIKAVNRHGAVITGAGGASGSASRAAIALHIDAAYVTVEGFDVQQAWGKGIQTTADNSRIQRNRIHNINQATYFPGYPGSPGDNVSGVRTDTGATNLYVGHNIIYDIRNAARTHNESGVELYRAPSAIVECNDISDMVCTVYFKDTAGNAQCRYNHLHGAREVFTYGTNNTFPYQFHHNVIDDFTEMVTNGDVANEVDFAEWWNNTIVFTANCRTGILFRNTSNTAVRFWNNLIHRNGGAPSGVDSYRDMNGHVGGFDLLDYNLYGTACQFTSPPGTPRTFDQFKSTTGRDEHSINANPTYAAGGSGAYAYRLDAASPGYQQGRVGGVDAGALVNIGAFESLGQTEQIGPDWL